MCFLSSNFCNFLGYFFLIKLLFCCFLSYL
nr:MAG TPA: E2-like protein [Caudoviricetes sp.]